MAAVPYVEIKEAWLGGKMTAALHDFWYGSYVQFPRGTAMWLQKSPELFISEVHIRMIRIKI